MSEEDPCKGCRMALLAMFELTGKLAAIQNTPVADSALEEIHERIDSLRSIVAGVSAMLSSGTAIQVVADFEAAAIRGDAWKEAALGALHRSCIGCAGGRPMVSADQHRSHEPCTADPILRDAVAELLHD